MNFLNILEVCSKYCSLLFGIKLKPGITQDENPETLVCTSGLSKESILISCACVLFLPPPSPTKKKQQQKNSNLYFMNFRKCYLARFIINLYQNLVTWLGYYFCYLMEGCFLLPKKLKLTLPTDRYLKLLFFS